MSLRNNRIPAFLTDLSAHNGRVKGGRKQAMPPLALNAISSNGNLIRFANYWPKLNAPCDYWLRLNAVNKLRFK